ncbi:ABC transporter ATP-binding protein [Pirellulaceae bacterium SH449]
MSVSDPLVEMSEVVVELNGFRILDINELIIPRNENVIIFGPNGSGKSTLLKLLMKFFYPSAIENRSGVIRILGKEAWNVWELRSQIGFVSSEIDHHFMTGRSGRLTPLDAVLTGFESSELEIDPSAMTPERMEIARNWLDFFELEANSTKRVSWLSTGERRRVMLARSMVLGASSLLLDEPTSGLDMVAREKLLRKLEELAASGIQIVLVTHHLEEVVAPIERCVMLKNGSIVQDDTVAHCFTAESISMLFDARIHVCKISDRYSANLLSQ